MTSYSSPTRGGERAVNSRSGELNNLYVLASHPIDLTSEHRVGSIEIYMKQEKREKRNGENEWMTLS